MTGKPTMEDLGIDVGAVDWQRSGAGEGSIEVAFVHGNDRVPAEHRVPAEDRVRAEQQAHGSGWVLMRVAGDPDGRVLVYDRNEWECFLDGVRKGEFQDASE